MSNRQATRLGFFISTFIFTNGKTVKTNLQNETSKNHLLRLFVSGDWGGIPLESKKPYSISVSESMERMASIEKPDATLLLGDNFYDNGVKDVNDEQFESVYKKMFEGNAMQDVPMYLLTGNHDYNGNVTAQIEYTNLDSTGRWNYPDWYYNVNFLDGKLELLMIDTSALQNFTEFDSDQWGDIEIEPTDRRTPQYEWIEKVLSTSTAEMLIVAGHYPVFSHAKHGSTEELVDNLKPLFEKYEVTAYLCGHDHNMQYITYGDDFTKHFVIGQGTQVKYKSDYGDELGGSDLDYFWDFDIETVLGAYGIIDFDLNENGRVEGLMSWVDARNDDIVFTEVLEGKKDFVTTNIPSTFVTEATSPNSGSGVEIASLVALVVGLVHLFMQ